MAASSLFLVILLCGLATAADVFAHFMVANTYNYTQTEWKADFVAASEIGIDGFALNWGPPDCSLAPNSQDWYVARIEDAFAVAATNEFKLIYSFDMSYTPAACSIGWNTTFMATMISKYAKSPAAYIWNGDVLVSSYGGEGYGNEFFAELKSVLAGEGVTISLSPALTTYSLKAQSADPNGVATGMLANYTAIDGYLNWQAWPADTDTNLTAGVDVEFQAAFENAGRTGPYIMGVSPWQFKDFNDGYYNSWVEYSDVLFPNRWEQAISTVQPDIVEIITWNDFEESHYIRDLPPVAGPAAVGFGVTGAYIYGQTHSAWRVMAQYYISWYKTGLAPKVTEDRVVFWYRVHPKEVSCSSGTNNIGVVRNAAYPADAVFAWALVSENSTISMNVGSNQNWTFQATTCGPKLNMVPFPNGIDNAYPSVAVQRGEETLHAATGAVAITEACAYENYNPVVGLTGPALTASPKMGNGSGTKGKPKKLRHQKKLC
ncbi:hypothetical protein LTR78_010407 [Recurvomyces mirabilis]|uniref:Glycoside hydrolase family 71 protein n=1 Tax=Recurvomyces mirabilis TaxID=574656 RepID=A0AAE0TN42_9PEZI|nr:hypothetical protein LTR78_010407 [Recurvomyces mirabilis]KAK5149758.1 hypothetical protein LTS14_010679 [Recurvomyces mirabilis]